MQVSQVSSQMGTLPSTSDGLLILCIQREEHPLTLSYPLDAENMFDQTADITYLKLSIDLSISILKNHTDDPWEKNL